MELQKAVNIGIQLAVYSEAWSLTRVVYGERGRGHPPSLNKSGGGALTDRAPSLFLAKNIKFFSFFLIKLYFFHTSSDFIDPCPINRHASDSSYQRKGKNNDWIIRFIPIYLQYMLYLQILTTHFIKKEITGLWFWRRRGL